MEFQLTSADKLSVLEEKRNELERLSFSFTIDLKIGQKVEDQEMVDVAMQQLRRIETAIKEVDAIISDVESES